MTSSMVAHDTLVVFYHPPADAVEVLPDLKQLQVYGPFLDIPHIDRWMSALKNQAEPWKGEFYVRQLRSPNWPNLPAEISEPAAFSQEVVLVDQSQSTGERECPSCQTRTNEMECPVCLVRGDRVPTTKFVDMKGSGRVTSGAKAAFAGGYAVPAAEKPLDRGPPPNPPKPPQPRSFG